MYIEKLGRNNRQIDSKLLQFAAGYYGVDYLKLRMSAKPATQLDGYRSYAVNCKNNKGEKINTLIWFSDLEFGDLTDNRTNNDYYFAFMVERLREIDPTLALERKYRAYAFSAEASGD